MRKEAPDRNIHLFLLIMKSIVGRCSEVKSNDRVLSFDSAYYDNNSVPIEFYNFDISYDETMSESDIQSAVTSAVLSYAVSQSYSMTAADVLLVAVAARSNGRSFTSPTRSLDSAFQISTTRDAAVSYSVSIASSLSLTGGQDGKVILEYANESGFTTGVTEVCEVRNGNTGTLTIGLNTVQTYGGVVSGMIPAGKYVRMRSVDTTSTPTQAYVKAQEVLL